MKKRSLKERKEAFKRAYYNELEKQNIINTENALNEINEGIAIAYNPLSDKTKAELIEIANNKGVKVNLNMTKAELIRRIEEE